MREYYLNDRGKQIRLLGLSAWRRYLELDSARAFDDHGRGIAMARLVSFDRLDYNLRGNIVTAVIETP